MRLPRQKINAKVLRLKMFPCCWSSFSISLHIRRADLGLIRRGGVVVGLRRELRIESSRLIMAWLTLCCMFRTSCLGYIFRVGKLILIARYFLILFSCLLICLRRIVYLLRCRRSNCNRFIRLLISWFDIWDMIVYVIVCFIN